MPDVTPHSGHVAAADSAAGDSAAGQLTDRRPRAREPTTGESGIAEPILGLAGVLRVLRRRADLSQRELAARSGVPPTTVASVEAGASANPTLRTAARLVAATGARLAIIDVDGVELAGEASDGPRDGACRRFPAHLDLRPVSWRGARRVDRFSFLRSRPRRDFARRFAAGEVREGLDYEIRRLGPGDAGALHAMLAPTADPDRAGRRGSADAPSGREALRYLRDPALRHWIAEERGIIDVTRRGRVIGHLAAHVCHRPFGRPAVVVTAVALAPDRRAEEAGRLLVAALAAEAVRLGTDTVTAVAGGPATGRVLRRLGFRSRTGPTGPLTLRC